MNTLLTELDGLDSRKGVYVIAATNRPDMIDPAMCRPGRLDKLLYVDLPTAEERVEIVRKMTRKVPFANSSDEEALGRIRAGVEALVRDGCDGYSGADLAALVREAGVVALRRVLGTLDAMETEGEVASSTTAVYVGLLDFERALDKVQPSVSLVQKRRYQALRSKFAGLPVKGGKNEDEHVEDKEKASSR